MKGHSYCMKAVCLNVGSRILTHCNIVETHRMLCVTVGHGKARKLCDLTEVHTHSKAAMSVCRTFYRKMNTNFCAKLLTPDFFFIASRAVGPNFRPTFHRR